MNYLKGILILIFLSGCARTEGKKIVDFIQYLLNQDTWFRWIACILLVYLLLQSLRIIRLVLQFLFNFLKKTYRFTFIWGKRNLIIITVLGTLMWAFSSPLIDFLQDIEQRFFYPVFVHQFENLNAEHRTAIFEAELDRTLDPYQKAVTIRRTREIAAKIRSTPLAIYEAAYLECGLKPFEVRSDGVAAGWIQFTRAGLKSLEYKGKAVTLEDVVQACRAKDIEFMMDLTEIYLVRKYERSGKIALNNTIDLYLAIFAPAFIGASSDAVVYQGFENPSYYKNAGLDGWYIAKDAQGREQIFRKRAKRDGKITILEIFLAIEAKKNRLLDRYLK
jgi:hypothetical protein